MYELTENIEYGSTLYWIELNYKSRVHLLQLDIQFLKEQQLLNNLMETWKKKELKLKKETRSLTANHSP